MNLNLAELSALWIVLSEILFYAVESLRPHLWPAQLLNQGRVLYTPARRLKNSLNASKRLRRRKTAFCKAFNNAVFNDGCQKMTI